MFSKHHPQEIKHNLQIKYQTQLTNKPNVSPKYAKVVHQNIQIQLLKTYPHLKFLEILVDVNGIVIL